MAKKQYREEKASRTSFIGRGFVFALRSVLLVNLIFYTTFTDPINVPKFITLFISAGWLLGINYYAIRTLVLTIDQKIYITLSLSFLICMFIQSLLSENMQTAFFGENLRKNGFINYFSLVIFAIFFSICFKQSKIKIFFRYVLATNFALTFYGTLQILGLDPFSWTGSGGIFTSIGNSNFAGTVYSIVNVLSIVALKFYLEYWQKILIFILITFNYLCLYFTNARQSLLVSIFVLTVLCIYWIYVHLRKIFIPAVTLFTIFTIIGLLGIFNLGPFGKYLYKDSISVRIYYWKAAIKMVENFPFTGVGIDNYGSYFKQYRDVGYPLKYGWDLTSTNAHNLPLQMFSTGGVLLGLTFLFMTFYVLYVGIKNIKKSEGAERYLSLGIFLAWLAYQLQLLVSVDNVAMAIWGWILSGMIIALFSNSDQMEATRIESVRAGREKQLLLSSIILLPILFMSFNQLKAESNMYKLMGGFKPENQATAEGFKTFAISALKVPYLDPTYKLTIGSYLVDYGDSDNGLRAVDEVLQKNSRNLQAYWVKATNFENKQNFEQAVLARKKIEELDPWNAKNYYIMVLDYKSLGNETQAKFYGDKIKSFAQNTDIGKQLISNFPNL